MFKQNSPEMGSFWYIKLMEKEQPPFHVSLSEVITAFQEWNVDDDSIAELELIEDALKAVQSVENYQKISEILKRRVGQFVLYVDYNKLQDYDDEHEEKSAVQEFLFPSAPEDESLL